MRAPITYAILLQIISMKLCWEQVLQHYQVVMKMREEKKSSSNCKRVIKESGVSVIIFSNDYVSSSLCLDELVMILDCKRISRRAVLSIFYHVDHSEVRKQKGRTGEAFDRHEELGGNQSGNEWKARVRKWKEALKEVADLGGMVLQNQADGHESKFIQKILKVVENKRSRPVLYICPHLIGKERRVEKINSWLEDGSTDVDTLVICGIGGIGLWNLASMGNVMINLTSNILSYYRIHGKGWTPSRKTKKVVLQGLYQPCVWHFSSRSLKWSYQPLFDGVPGGKEGTMWLSHWKLENQLINDDVIEVTFTSGDGITVMEFGIKILHVEEPKVLGGSSCEDASGEREIVNPFWDVVLGDASSKNTCSVRLPPTYRSIRAAHEPFIQMALKRNMSDCN
ncbi:hypothetical protein K7X08_036458 [Anisodus acutangulus]|uniref:TIR domain-containing protein n=1 Tax=Anisodus acutangulus TaxID=402998 RepID=A0A9Q1L8Y3_9SOLA|nr:hypothetical protein K7X08_036458 [Anisodus acutangulus]